MHVKKTKYAKFLILISESEYVDKVQQFFYSLLFVDDKLKKIKGIK